MRADERGIYKIKKARKKERKERILFLVNKYFSEFIMDTEREFERSAG